MANFSHGILQTPGFYRRQSVPNWNFLDTTKFVYMPEQGRVLTAISLGLSDESGGVRVHTQDEGGDLDFNIGPGSPFIGNLYRPITIYPIVTFELKAGSPGVKHTMELYFWYDILPPCFPVRGPKVYIGTLVDIANVIIPINGRKRTSIYINVLDGDADVNVALNYNTPYGYNSYTLFEDTAMSANESFVYELDAANTPNTISGQHSSESKVPTLAQELMITSSVASNAIDYRIETRDY